MASYTENISAAKTAAANEDWAAAARALTEAWDVASPDPDLLAEMPGWWWESATEDCDEEVYRAVDRFLSGARSQVSMPREYRWVDAVRMRAAAMLGLDAGASWEAVVAEAAERWA